MRKKALRNLERNILFKERFKTTQDIRVYIDVLRIVEIMVMPK